MYVRSGDILHRLIGRRHEGSLRAIASNRVPLRTEFAARSAPRLTPHSGTTNTIPNQLGAVEERRIFILLCDPPSSHPIRPCHLAMGVAHRTLNVLGDISWS